jgi:hypothetical protein
MREIKINRIYKHFKGDNYLVLDIVIDSETNEEMVLYQALYDDKKLWCRPYDMFFDEVNKNGQKLRFELQKDCVFHKDDDISKSLYLRINGENEIIFEKTNTNACLSNADEYWCSFYINVNNDNINLEYSDCCLLTSELEMIKNDEAFTNMECNFKFGKYTDGYRYISFGMYPSEAWYTFDLSEYNYDLLKEYIKKVLN